MKKKIYKDECIDCGYIGEDAFWLIEGFKGPIHIHEEIYVKHDKMDPQFFDLTKIDAAKIAEKYQVDEELVEDLILDGEPICPKCKSKSYFQLTQEV